MTTKVDKRGRSRLQPYQGFTGLDSSRDLFNQDDGERQALHVLENAFADFRGQIVRDGPADYRFGSQPVKHVIHYDTDVIVAATEYGDGIHLESEQSRASRVPVESTRVNFTVPLTQSSSAQINAGETALPYVHSEGQDIMVFRDDVLLQEGVGFNLNTAGVITLASPAVAGETISVAVGSTISNPVSYDFVLPSSAIVTSTVFNRAIMLTARGLAPVIFDGDKFRASTSTAATVALPAFCTTVQQRLCIAGLAASDTLVMIGAANTLDTFFGDEAVDSQNQLRSGNLDIANLLGTADKITGISSFETDKLAIFTNDRAFVYKLDPDITLWELQTEASATYGCASHNTIKEAGTDLLYCSRSGIHALRRVTDNGLQISSVNLSEQIDQIYRSLFSQVSDPQEITAVWDQDESQYHVFFPVARTGQFKRLTMTVNGGDAGTSFSTGDFANARCGTTLGGNMVFGTSRGVFNINKIESNEGAMPDVLVETPVLWMGALDGIKQSSSITIQAYGDGELTITAIDDQNRDKWQTTVMLTDEDDDGRRTVPLPRQYERPMSIRFRGLRFKFEFKGTGLFRIIGFAVELV